MYRSFGSPFASLNLEPEPLGLSASERKERIAAVYATLRVCRSKNGIDASGDERGDREPKDLADRTFHLGAGINDMRVSR